MVAEMSSSPFNILLSRQSPKFYLRIFLLCMQDEIAFEKVTVVTPAKTVLVRDLSVRVPAGTNLLVTGPNGSGKSSLFRVLGGLWPAESGVVRKPAASEDGLSNDIFYVPQRPYVTKGVRKTVVNIPTEG